MRKGRGRFRIAGAAKAAPFQRRSVSGRPAYGIPERRRAPQGRGSLFGGWVFLLVLGLGAYVASRLPVPEKPVTGELRGAAMASDGDSLRLNGRRLRIEGIDAPEIGQTCRRGDAAWDCGAEARRRLTVLTAGATTRCRLHGHDRYGRDLGVCEAGGRDIGREMVLSGLAVSYGLYREEEATARDARAGLWSGDFVRPQEWRRSKGGPDESLHGGEDWPGLILQWIEDEVRTFAKRIIGGG